MTPAHTLLGRWMQAHRLSIAQTAERFGVSPYTVEAWLLGRNRPRQVVRIEIDEHTAGAVPCDGWQRPTHRVVAHARPWVELPAPAGVATPDDGLAA